MIDRLLCWLGWHLPMPDGRCCVCRDLVAESLRDQIRRTWSR